MGRLLFHLFFRFVNWLPRKTALRFGSALGSLVYNLAEMTKFRGALKNNIRTAFPNRFSDQEVERMARQHGRDLLQTLIEVMRFRELPALRANGIVRAEGLGHIDRALSKGKGAIILSAHLGNWELLISALGLFGYPVHAIVVKQSSPIINHLLVTERERYGSKVMYIHEADSQRISQILQNNGLILLLADQHHYGGSGRNIVNFFEKPVSVPGGPVAYSIRFEAPVIPAYTVREPGGRHKIIAEPELQLIRSEDAAEHFLENCQRYIHVFERWITKYPGQWMWSHERWAWLDENLKPKF